MTHDTVVIRPLDRPGARRTLVCLGFCGGGTAAYRDWARAVPEDTDLALVCYPGREGRFAEDHAPTWDALVADAADAVRAAARTPYVLFGHSMGGWVAFEAAVRLERAGLGPRALVVSSCNAPSGGVTERDQFPAGRDTDAQLLDWMRTAGLLPDYVLGDPDLTAMAVELMRADIRVRDDYRYVPGVRVQAPLQVLHGASDPVVDPAGAARWRELTTGAAEVTALPGGHFYTPGDWAVLPRHIAALRAVAAH
ncbi:thioesterase II family protein [Streptomyces sp. NBC_00091]|uniref:thioesterase II family protein n=1 Tax=Streptomyces sp. NBC_00091 TaxID=2975648 RepID=UPI002253E308|nr:alpha/beta fold hydrolase [Streptomyces sp. NBC_00091]MCX5380994.1 alpha/beta fold hydrolase [Streptomyces sp. NBC_00091]